MPEEMSPQDMVDATDTADTAAATDTAATTAVAVETRVPGPAPERASTRKQRVGTVISSKMDKTVVVTVERKVAHKVYGKQMARTKKYYAHDHENSAREGDIVRIEETRPLSKLKRWRVLEIVVKAK